MNPFVLVALANLQRRRRWDTAPRAPFADAGQAQRALAEDEVAITGLTQGDLPALTRLADATSELADGLALGRGPARRAVGSLNELDFITGALLETPYRGGKPLRHTLSGFHSARLGSQWRVLYRVDEAKHAVIVQGIQHRSPAYRRR